MQSINLLGNVVVSPDVIARNLGDETVLLNLKTGTYFGLDSVGARIWSLMQDGCAVAAIVDTLASEFDAQPSAIQADVVKLLADMTEQGLVSMSK